MATILRERYAAAVHAKSLKPDPRSTANDLDVLGAYGLAAKHLDEGFVTTGPGGQGYPIRKVPLAVPLERLFCGDAKAAKEIIEIMAAMTFEHSWKLKVKISQAQAKDVAKACLEWSRNGRCDHCGGHGKTLVPGTGRHGVGGVLSEHECQPCRGTGKRILEREFRQEWQELARWLVAEVERAAAVAGPRAMAALAPKLEI